MEKVRPVWYWRRLASGISDNIRTAFVLDVSFISEPLHALAEGIHVGVLEYVDGHDDLVEEQVGDGLTR